MNTTQQTITVFTDLLTTQPTLFAQATQDLVELKQTLQALTDNQVDEIAKAIRSFCKKQTAIREIVMSPLEKDRGLGGVSSSNPMPAEEKIIREQVLNAIRRVISATPTSQPAKPTHEQPAKPSR